MLLDEGVRSLSATSRGNIAIVLPIAQDNPPVSLTQPWVDMTRIAAANARDVLERTEDDRSRAERSAQATLTLAAMRVTRRIKFKPRPKSAPKPKGKKERTPELRAYFREYGRKWRARKKEAQAALSTLPATSSVSAIAVISAAVAE